MSKFRAQVFFSAALLSFCFYKLINPPDTQVALYWGGVSSVIAYWLPSPKDE